jgi:membrane protein YqaA with SNARE-associated domain
VNKISWRPIGALLWQAARRHTQRAPARAAPGGWQVTLRHLGGPGLFALAVLDGSPVPTLGGPDLVTALLAARHREPWYYYALMATIGGVIGSFITYSIARKAGEAYLARRFGIRRVRRLLQYFREWGGGTLVIAALLPPPFPATAVFAAAGILNYPARRYLAAIAAGRAIRYGLLAWAAEHYGRHFLRLVRHPERYVGWSVLAAAIIIVSVVAGAFMWRWVRTAETVPQAGADVPPAAQHD